MHVAADERKTIIHAHLKINHPERKQQTQTLTSEYLNFVMGSLQLMPNMFREVYLVCRISSLCSICLTRMMSFELEFTPNDVKPPNLNPQENKQENKNQEEETTKQQRL